ncbi:metal-binding protein [Longispora fulva]|uniref:YceD family protein n=1 Tax=Longispora fulva TaxID=619741 RepID=UPI0018CBBD07|nr:YceD family protein [Longispora fulva]GIG60664.1 metal-binding protein [Longispora fulva]
MSTHLDARAPLVLDTRELPRSPGAMRELRRTVPAPVDLGVELIGVPTGSELTLELRLQSVSEGVLVSGSVTAPLEGECGRCLRPINTTTVVHLSELFAYPDSTTAETTDEDEVSRLEGDLLDLEPTLRDTVVLALPTNPVCREDCPGLCSECGVPWDDLPDDHSHEAVDPRWAALGKIKASEE